MSDANQHITGVRFPTRSNPRVNRDYIITLKITLPLAPAETKVRRDVNVHIRYVPDRLICDAPRMMFYFNSLDGQDWVGIEDLANLITDDFCNELIPRWISVSLSLYVDGTEHSAHVTDKQPLWDNPRLIPRLE